MNHDNHVEEQLEYYRARASEYDEWFLRQGRYDQGSEHTQAWFHEVTELQAVLEELNPLSNVLELACGTGWWTEQLVKGADHVTAVDASPEVIKLNAARTKSPAISYIQADIFNWQSENKFDLVFFSFWLSHVPPERFITFWKTVENALVPGGRVFLIDSLYKQESTSRDQSLPEPESTVAKRKLNDGREFKIVKLFYTPEVLREKLEPLGWQVKANQTEHFFVYAEATRR